jgi:hypothetical protein
MRKQENRASASALARFPLQVLRGGLDGVVHRAPFVSRCTPATRAARNVGLKRSALATMTARQAAQIAGAADNLMPRF